MKQGTAVVGFLLSFLAGMGLMWGINHSDPNAVGEARAVKSVASTVDHSKAAVPVSADDATWGNPDAPVTIVEFSDFECPFCSRGAATVEELKRTYGPEKLRVVWKHTPLPMHQNAQPAHLAAEAVLRLGGNEAFWKFHDLAFQNQRALTPENFSAWAQKAGVDPKKFAESLSKDKATLAKKLNSDLALGKRIGANGTPNFRINGLTLSGAQPAAKFKELIDKQLAEAKKLVAAGTAKADVYVELTKKNAAQPAAPAEAEDTAIWQVPVVKTDPVTGPADALVTLVVYSDFECPFCSRVEETLAQVKQAYPQDLRIVWKDSPLAFHQRAVPAATLARVAFDKNGNDGFWKAHALLFKNQKDLSDEALQKYATELGLSWAEVKAAIDSKKYAPIFDDTGAAAADLNVRGTPHFFINGRRLSGAQPLEQFKTLVDEQLKAAKAIEARGVARADVYAEIMKTAKTAPPPETKTIPAATAANPSRGPANAPVTITLFSDFECPFCSRIEPTMAALEKEYGPKVRIVWRNLPLKFHKNAPLAAQAAMEAFAQKGSEGFWKFHDAIFAAQKEGIGRETLERIAKEQNLDLAKFKVALDTNKHQAVVDQDAAVAEKAGISGTPAVLVNQYFVGGAQPPAAFKRLVNRALKDAGSK